MSRPLRVAILLSGSGRTLENLCAQLASGELSGLEIVNVGSNKPDVYGLVRAQNHEIPTFVEPDPSVALAHIESLDVDLICLCGYLKLLPIPPRWEGKVLNIHPSLLPKFGGPGFYGHHVHEAVLAAGETESGCTVHWCSGEYDRGPIVHQERVPVLPDDTPDTLAVRVFEAECRAYPAALRIVMGR
ncbi:MAG: phosphoribosylglycinamide formyltransferase [Planctomycetota bacterium]